MTLPALNSLILWNRKWKILGLYVARIGTGTNKVDCWDNKSHKDQSLGWNRVNRPSFVWPQHVFNVPPQRNLQIAQTEAQLVVNCRQGFLFLHEMKKELIFSQSRPLEMQSPLSSVVDISRALLRTITSLVLQPKALHYLSLHGCDELWMNTNKEHGCRRLWSSGGSDENQRVRSRDRDGLSVCVSSWTWIRNIHPRLMTTGPYRAE